MGVAELYERAAAEFDARVQAVPDDGWSHPTPNTEWDVRTLVNHLVNENVWIPPLLEGKTIAEVGNAFDGDLLGDDPKGTWTRSVEKATQAMREPGALDRTVHLSFGDTSGADYISQVLTDHVIHAWDLARAVGADERLDPELVEFSYSLLAPQVDDWRAGGAFGEEVRVPPDADRQTQLLGLTGRSA
jgi:uncharacterized protein (TIGR03086 family)